MEPGAKPRNAPWRQLSSSSRLRGTNCTMWEEPGGSRLWMSFASLQRESYCFTQTLTLRPQCPQQELVSYLSEDFAGLWTLEGDALEKNTE